MPNNFKKFFFIPAKPSHYQKLADFFVDIFGPKYHICFLLNSLLNAIDDPKVVHSNVVALLQGRVVASACRMFFPGHYSWVSGLAVDPQFRKSGEAKYLIEISERIARENNINHVKVVISDFKNNLPIFKKLGFSEVALWHIMGYELSQAKASDSKFPGIREAVNSDLERMEKFLSKSSYFAIAGGMYAEDLTWYPLDRLWLDDLIKKGRALLSEDRSGIQGLAIINKKSLINPLAESGFSVMEVGYFDGDVSAILDFIKKNYHPNFLRIYSADGIPLKHLPAEIKVGYFSGVYEPFFLFGGLNRLNLSTERLFFTVAIIMQKTIKNG